jgi:transposase
MGMSRFLAFCGLDRKRHWTGTGGRHWRRPRTRLDAAGRPAICVAYATYARKTPTSGPVDVAAGEPWAEGP